LLELVIDRRRRALSAARLVDKGEGARKQLALPQEAEAAAWAELAPMTMGMLRKKALEVNEGQHAIIFRSTSAARFYIGHPW
jgi:hypothetical protein